LIKNLYLIDGHAAVYKYYYAYAKAPLQNAAGENTSAAYGLGRMVLTLLKVYPVTHIGVIFDPPGGNFRKKLYPEYKANREKKPEIEPLLAMAYRLFKEWGIYTSAFTNYEADDVIGTLAVKGAQEGANVYIVTRDKDYMQLVNDKIKLIDLGNRIGEDTVTIIDQTTVKRRLGIYPEQVTELLTLAGDTSDNIPGVEGIGMGKPGKPGKAVQLLEKYGSVAGIYDNLDKLTESQKSRFEAAQEKIPLYKKLVTIEQNVPLNLNLDDLKRPEKYSESFIKYLEYLELASIIRDL
jgi:DNA polymerase-1